MTGDQQNTDGLRTTDLKTHTPGPWRERAPNIDGEVDETYREITAGVGHFPDEPGERGFKLVSFISPADARLIAAAPDLYDVCKELRDWIHGLRPGRCLTDEISQRLIAALDKAEGRSGG